MTERQLASRTMKARRTGGVCPACWTTIVAGQRIGLVGKVWHHVGCLVRRQPVIGPASGA